MKVVIRDSVLYSFVIRPGSLDRSAEEVKMSRILTILQGNFLFRTYKYYIIDSVLIIKNRGFKELLRARGLKFILAVIVYYTIRDSMIYFVIPFLVARGLF